MEGFVFSAMGNLTLPLHLRKTLYGSLVPLQKAVNSHRGLQGHACFGPVPLGSLISH